MFATAACQRVSRGYTFAAKRIVSRLWQLKRGWAERGPDFSIKQTKRGISLCKSGLQLVVLHSLRGPIGTPVRSQPRGGYLHIYRVTASSPMRTNSVQGAWCPVAFMDHIK